MLTQYEQALGDLRRRSLRMASGVEEMLQEACGCVFQFDQPRTERTFAREQDLDVAEVAVEAEVIRLMALHQPVGRDLRELFTILKVNMELESVADCAVNIAQRAQHQVVQRLARTNEDLRAMVPAVRQALRRAIACYGQADGEAVVEEAERIILGDSAINALYGQIVRETVTSAESSEHALSAHLDILSVAKNLERVADIATTIAKNVIFLSSGEIVRHRVPEDDGAGESPRVDRS